MWDAYIGAVYQQQRDREFVLNLLVVWCRFCKINAHDVDAIEGGGENVFVEENIEGSRLKSSPVGKVERGGGGSIIKGKQ